MRHVALVFLVAVSPLAVAAPVPKQTANAEVVKLFGTPVEPKDCSITFDKTDKSVTLTAVPSPDQPKQGTAGEYHALWSPRTGREVDGDFDVTVNITLPDQKDTTVTAGLYASYGENDYVVLNASFAEDVRKRPYRLGGIDSIISGKVWNSQRGGVSAAAESFDVRLTRTGKTITPYRLTDGKWKAIVAADTTHDWPGQGTVGVYVRAAKGEGTATFRDFKLTAPEK